MLLLFPVHAYAQVYENLGVPSDQNILNTDSTPISKGLNYLKMNAGECSAKNILDELQADGGSALTAQELYVWYDSTWVKYTTEDTLTIEKDKIVAFDSNVDFFFDLDQNTCKDTEENKAREQQIQQARGVNNVANETTTNFATNLLRKIESLFNELTNRKQTLEENNTIISNEGGTNFLENTTFKDVTVTGDLFLGLMKINSLNDSIDVLGATCISDGSGLNAELCDSQSLYLQKGLAGNVNIFNGKIVLEPDGTINVSKLAIDVSNEASASAGKATIPAGQTSIEINTTALTGNSLILVTPNTAVAVGKEIVDGDTFRIVLGAPALQSVMVDWLIVDAN